MSSPTSDLDNNLLSTSEIVRAGAGAGKTTRLINQVIEFVQLFEKKHERKPRVVLTTFTKKATQELKERLILKACELNNNDLIEYFSSQNIHISTIHGVLNVFLKQYGHLFSLDTHFEIMSSLKTIELKKTLIRDIVRSDKEFEYLLKKFSYLGLIKKLDSFYEKKMCFPEMRYSQETDFVIHSFFLLNHKLEEFEKVCKSIQAETDNESWLGYTSEVLSVINNVKSFSNDSVSLKGSVDLLSNLPKKPRYSSKKPVVSEETDASLKMCMKELKSFLEQEALNVEHWPEFIRSMGKIQKLGVEYTDKLLQSKLNSGQIEMADLEILSLFISKKYPDILSHFSESWDYWLIDEYQDTSPTQVELINHLKGVRPHFVVGDPQQSIYLFRGAEVQVFKDKETELKESGINSLLNRNYRSHPELLSWVNDCVTSVSSQFTAMDVRDYKEDEEKGQNSVCIYDLEKDEENKSIELDCILNHIKNLLQKGVSLENIAVLARTNAHLKKVSHYLQQNGIATHIYSSSGFYQRREVLDALSLLKFLVNPRDDFNLIQLLRSPWFRLEDDLLANSLVDVKYNYWQAFLDHKQEKGFEAIEQLASCLVKRNEIGITGVLEYVISEGGLLESSYIYDPTGGREANIWKFLALIKEEERAPGFNFLNFVYQSQAVKSMESFSGESEAVSALEPQRVQIMTVHASKGLEFDYVFLPFLNKRPQITHFSNFSFDYTSNKWSFPMPIDEGGKAISTPTDLMYTHIQKNKEQLESERVFYVALTRAKKSLILSWQRPLEKNSWSHFIERAFNINSGEHVSDSYIYQVWHAPVSDNIQLPKEQMNSEVITAKPMVEPLEAKKYVYNLREKKSVSSLIDLKNAKDSQQVQKNISWKNDFVEFYKKPIHGVYLHKILESLKYDPSFDFASVSKKWFGSKAKDYLQALEYIKNLKELPLLEIINNGHVEWGYQLATVDGIVEGQIDLWGSVGQGDKKIVYVLDYKTGSQKYEAKAMQQLEYYAEALYALGEGSEFHRVVIYPMEQKISKTQICSFPQS
ncbi:MAG: UvrD-helicase domain-containing protein [Bdellovibrionaceae bacterium]|jgi:ATP-dependent helicase/nuclease subunit A|nr:UvrD-helicase domain-containing protein [Pseudobdellovibrionaceae bacterium]